jgi:ketosteroid isomerase-like protein
MTKTDIAKAFSIGEFDRIYDYIAEDAEWVIVEDVRFVGKKAIVENCKHVGDYFKSVTTDFKTYHVIADDNKVAINGTAEFKKANKRLSFVSACDIYEFNEDNRIQKITSYCIQAK